MSSSSSSKCVRVTFLMAISWRNNPRVSGQYFPISKRVELDWSVQNYLPAGTDQGGLQHVSCAPGELGLPHQVSGRTGASTSTGGPDLARTRTFKQLLSAASQRVIMHTEHAAHRHPLPGLQAEFHWELEDDGSTGSHLPLQLPVPQVLILMVRY